eukprot:7281720-Alexandrium_andersonii.AAC.1
MLDGTLEHETINAVIHRIAMMVPARRWQRAHTHSHLRRHLRAAHLVVEHRARARAGTDRRSADTARAG